MPRKRARTSCCWSGRRAARPIASFIPTRARRTASKRGPDVCSMSLLRPGTTKRPIREFGGTIRMGRHVLAGARSRKSVLGARRELQRVEEVRCAGVRLLEGRSNQGLEEPEAHHIVAAGETQHLTLPFESDAGVAPQGDLPRIGDVAAELGNESVLSALQDIIRIPALNRRAVV